jgi:hypothetical protein
MATVAATAATLFEKRTDFLDNIVTTLSLFMTAWVACSENGHTPPASFQNKEGLFENVEDWRLT